MARRYDQYPELARVLAQMTDEGRQLVAYWHRVLTTALEGHVPQSKEAVREEALHVGNSEEVAKVAASAAELALRGWLHVMREVAGLVAEGPGDWCCRQGMAAHPNPCPQHGWDSAKSGHTEPGLIIERVGPGEADRERCVAVGVADGPYWVSVPAGVFYDEADLREWGPWVVVGHV